MYDHNVANRLQVTRSIVKLQYIGKQEFPGNQSIRLWNIDAPGHPSHRSTVSLITLKQLGIVPKAFYEL